MTESTEPFKILCIDPDIVRCNTIAQIAKKAGFDTIITTDVPSTDEIVAGLQPDIVLVIAAQITKKFDGLAIRQQLIEKGAEAIPFVLFSEKIDPLISQQAQTLGITKFITGQSKHDEIIALLTDITRDRLDHATEQRMLKESFISESKELLENLEPLLLAIEKSPKDLANISSIFRIIHTIKGASGVLSNHHITTFLHAFEDVLSGIKNQQIAVGTSTISVLLAAYDFLTKIIQFLERPNSSLPDLKSATATLRQALSDNTNARDGQLQGSVTSNDDAHDLQPRSENVPVPTQMLDEFLHLTGETTVIRNMVNKLVRAIERQLPRDKDVELLIDLLDEMHKINATMQTKTAELRKTPMTQVLKKIPRTARDISNQLGKNVKIITSGDNLRVDTAIAQALSNSLIHMVRNSLDHGIELPDVRAKSGKPREGTIQLSIRELKDNVIVEVADDGAGIDHERIRNKLLEIGHIDRHLIDKMNRDLLLKQIFEPGFSTAKVITDVSGRGVGMDMVRTSIEQLRGRIDINSEIGKGTVFTFTIPIPKSVVIINALIVGASSCSFAIPQDNIVRLLRIEENNRQNEIIHLPGTAAYRLNGQLIPLLSLRSALGLTDEFLDRNEDLNIVVVRWDGGTYGLIVDTVYDAEDIVVKSLHHCVDRVGAYAGATFLGDGTVSLIIDIPGIARLTHQVNESITLKSTDVTSINPPTVQTTQSGLEILLFLLHKPGYYAIPLNQVFRLEEIKTSNIAQIGNQNVYRYRNELIPLLDFSLSLDGNTNSLEIETNKTNLIILTHNNNLFATPILRVIDVRRIESNVITPPVHEIGVHGLITIDDHIATIIDLPAIIALSSLNVPNPLEKSATQTIPSNPDQTHLSENCADLGWGVF